MNIKRILCVFLNVCMVLALIGCGRPSDEEAEELIEIAVENALNHEVAEKYGVEPEYTVDSIDISEKGNSEEGWKFRAAGEYSVTVDGETYSAGYRIDGKIIPDGIIVTGKTIRAAA